MEFGFLVSQRYADNEGYLQIILRIRSHYPDRESVDLTKYSGCFNDNVPEFYGSPGDRTDCPFYDETGRDTDTGMHIWGQEWAAKPMLVHDLSREW
jgi:hypothetical protein